MDFGTHSGWALGYLIGLVVVLVVAALVVPILLLAHRIGNQAEAVNNGLQSAVKHTAALDGLNTTISYAVSVIEGLKRGRKKFGG